MLKAELTTAESGGPPPRDPGTRLYLILHAPGVSDVVTLDDGDEVVAGRAADAALRIDCDDVSRAHAVFRRRGAVVEIEDLTSRNGTWLDGQRLVAVARLWPGAAVRIGPARISLALCAEALSGPGEPAAAMRGEAEPPDASMIEGHARRREPDPGGASALVIADEAMQRLYTDARRVASASCPVLIVGETGAGKEGVAEHLHRAGPRAAKPFVRLNCTAVPEALIESELFGHEKGAFTGADRRRIGWIEAAHGGTLYLDEIGEMSLAMQAKLLRVLETGRLTRVGSSAEIAIDLRVVCATHRDLDSAVRAGTFRADLFYRIAAVVLAVPPLRDRPVEITLLATRFAAASAARIAVPVPVFDPEALAAILRYRWPGNVRELRNAVERAVVLCRGARITAADLPDALRAVPASAVDPMTAGRPGTASMREQIDEAERAAIAAALASENGNQTRAARRLGISRRNLVGKLTKYRLR